MLGELKRNIEKEQKTRLREVKELDKSYKELSPEATVANSLPALTRLQRVRPPHAAPRRANVSTL